MNDRDPWERIETSFYLFGWAVLILAFGLFVLMLCFGVAIMMR